MKRASFALLCLLVPACAEAPYDDGPERGTAHVRTANGILEVAYVVRGSRVLVDDMAFPVDEFFGAVIDPVELDAAIAASLTGDGDHDRAVVRAIGRARWPGGVIPYRYDAGITNSHRYNIDTAIAHWEANTPFRFVARTTETDFVTFIVGDGNGACNSDVGRSGGEQFLQVETCDPPRVAHEIGHLVGFFHEHQRADRDQFVTVNFDNIDPDHIGNFYNFYQRVDGGDGTDAGNYDYGSLMHYDAMAFSVNGKPTLVPTHAGVAIGQRIGLSRADIQAAYRLVTPGGTYGGGPALVGLSRDANLGGMHQDFGLGTFVASRGDFGGIGDNQTSSIFVGPGVVVYASTGGRFEPSAIYTSTQNTLAASMDNAISSITVARAVTVYRNANRSGVSQTFRIGDWSASGGHFGVIGDNQISSLHIPPGLVAELCTSTSGGTCVTYEGNVASLGSSMDNQASVIHVKPAVTLYEELALAGVRKSLTAGTYTAASFGAIGDNDLSSMVVGDGLQARLCTNSSGTGTCEDYRGDVSALGYQLHNNASWIRIEAATAPP
ncbi:MAG TPA: M12 family metallopeptidase [Kofleriaceae bacterium]|nr:M12 family metallopeptidase [Kofleriaceae bacterium]